MNFHEFFGMVRERFIAADDIINRAGISSAILETLREAGALGGLPETSQVTFF